MYFLFQLQQTKVADIKNLFLGRLRRNSQTPNACTTIMCPNGPPGPRGPQGTYYSGTSPLGHLHSGDTLCPEGVP